MSRNNETKDIYLEIKSMIKQGRFAPNERLNQLHLADELQVSRTPVATALHMLAAEGYLDQKHNSGFYVHKVTLQEVQELLLARAALESAVAYDIAENADNEALCRLEKTFQRLENMELPDNESGNAEFLRADQQCHKTLLETSKNTWVMRINENIKLLEHPYALGILRDPGEVLQEHRSILQAILRREPLAAQNAMFTHILHTRAIVLESKRNIESVGMSISDSIKLF